jgi:hypothetical protein
MSAKKRKYRAFDPLRGYPVGKFLFYECLRCGDVLPSSPSDSVHCTCRNIMIDVDAGRMSIQEPTEAKLFSEKGTRDAP